MRLDFFVANNGLVKAVASWGRIDAWTFHPCQGSLSDNACQTLARLERSSLRWATLTGAKRPCFVRPIMTQHSPTRRSRQKNGNERE